MWLSCIRLSILKCLLLGARGFYASHRSNPGGTTDARVEGELTTAGNRSSRLCSGRVGRHTSGVSNGVSADTIYLPDVGIYGNGHNYMLQNNADEIAEKVYLPWLKENVK
jgi:hypothetical protein